MKAAGDATPFVPARELEIFERLEREAHGPFPKPAIRKVFREIISASISLQRGVSVAYLGPPATYTHQAAIQQFGQMADLRPAATTDAIFAQVESGQAEFGVVPIENSSEGVVSHTLDLFVDSPLTIAAEIHVPIHHDLLSRSRRPARDPRGALAPAGARAVPRLARAEPAQRPAADHALDRAGGGAGRPQRGDRRDREPDRGRAVRPARGALRHRGPRRQHHPLPGHLGAGAAAQLARHHVDPVLDQTRPGRRALQGARAVPPARREPDPDRVAAHARARLGVRVLLRLRGPRRGREGRRRDRASCGRAAIS